MNRDSLRWSASLAVVLATHAAAMGAIIASRDAEPLIVPPPSAMMIELEPLPTVQPPPPAPPKPVSEPPRALPPAKRPEPKKAEVPLPRQDPRSAPAPAAAPKVIDVPVPSPPAETHSETATAPAPSPTPNPARQEAVTTWQGRVLAHLERHKRYPRAARFHRQQGVVLAAFTIDREGRVIAQKVQRSSGHEVLDGETMDLLQRAQPLPPPPPEIEGSALSLMVPVNFSLR